MKKAPFAVLLVTSDYEFLVRHPSPSKDFSLIGFDSVLKSNVYFRKRTYQTNLLATFPAVGNLSTIVVGQAENTLPKTSTAWVLTLMHEHFHQWQDSGFNLDSEVNALYLSGGDETGMWMLNYPFPYSTPEVDRQFLVLGNLLAETLQANDDNDFSIKLRTYLATRQQLQSVLSPDDYKYFRFSYGKRV